MQSHTSIKSKPAKPHLIWLTLHAGPEQVDDSSN
ncbi:hypothetical protein RUESEDTHA_00092 [Ruegeria sp. THAF57]|nr:hypothetical protein RUESEDTHA_00092 [Ruegeria sp. THAF57]